MKLLYLYVDCPKKDSQDVYDSISGLDLNFDSAVRFSYNRERKCLAATSGVEISPEFYSSSLNVCALSAVVGANGAGKTSIARVLSALMRRSGSMGDWIVVADLGGEIVYETSIRELRVVGYSCKKSNSVLDGFRLIYLSSHFSEVVQVEADGEKVIDLSTTGLLNDRSARFQYDDDEGEEDIITNPLVVYRTRQFRWLSQFAVEYVRVGEAAVKATSIRLPKYVVIRNDVSTQAANWRYYVDKVRDKNEIEYENLFRLERALGARDNLPILPALIVNYCGVYWRSHGCDIDTTKEEDPVALELLYLADRIARHSWGDESEEEEALENDYDDFIDQTIQRMRMSGWAQAPGCFELCEFLQLFRALIRDCECSDSEVKIDIANVSLMERFVEVLDKYHELAKVDSVLEFDIDPGMSSGELSYLMLWSRLYHQFGRCKPGAGKECLVFVDEGETTLHPEWQRRLVANMIWFFGKFGADIRVHLMFASHSPILLSDIPKGNVCFLLNREDEAIRNAEEEDLSNLQNTFGANIFDLYRLTFFLKDGTLGLFAQGKIDDLLSRIRTRFNLTATSGDRKVNESLKSRVGRLSKNDVVLTSIIGDPFVSSYLKRRFESLVVETARR